MSVSIDDVRKIAGLARVAVDNIHAASLASELSGILSHMDVLERVDTSGAAFAPGAGDGGTPLRPDGGEPVRLSDPPQTFAPDMLDGFFMVPRLATHDAVEGGA